MQLTQKQLIAILQSALAAFRSDVDSDISAARILTLLAVADQRVIPHADLERELDGLSASAVSRILLDLSNLKRDRTPGPDLVQQIPDPAYRKRNLVYPTQKAQQWLMSLTDQVNQAIASK